MTCPQPDPAFTLPPMVEGTLAADDLARLLGEIAAHAQVLEVLVKRAPDRFVDDGEAPPLEAVAGLLASGAVRGAQVRYRWDGAVWFDAILAAPGGGYRIVRVRHDAAIAGVSPAG